MDINKKLLILAFLAVFALGACNISDEDLASATTPTQPVSTPTPTPPVSTPATTTLKVEQLERNPEKMKASNSSYMGPSLGTPSGGGAR